MKIPTTKRGAWRALVIITIAFWSFLAVVFFAASAHAAPSYTAACSWDNPGHRPFMGNVPAAVDRYTEIPADVRARLKARMQARSYEDQVTITRDKLTGKAGQYTDLRMMHFAQGQVCGTVSRAKWSAGHTERALIYCESGHCIAVPSICRNVSLITPPPAGATAGGAPATLPEVPSAPVIPEAPALPPTTQTAPFVDPVPPAAPDSFAAVAAGEAATPFADGALWALGALAGLLGGALLGGGLHGGGGAVGIPVLPLPVTPPIPEPATYAMLLIGLCAVLFAVWREERRKPRPTMRDVLAHEFKDTMPSAQTVCEPSAQAKARPWAPGPTILVPAGVIKKR